MVTMDFHETLSHVLTQEGAQIALEGSHEARVWNALPVKGQGTPLTVQQLQQAVGKESASVGQGRAFKVKWIGKEGDGFVKLVCLNIKVRELLRSFMVFDLWQVTSIEDKTQLELRQVDSTGTLQAGEKALADLRKRKLIIQKYTHPKPHSLWVDVVDLDTQEGPMVHGAQGIEL